MKLTNSPSAVKRTLSKSGFGSRPSTPPLSVPSTKPPPIPVPQLNLDPNAAPTDLTADDLDFFIASSPPKQSSNTEASKVSDKDIDFDWFSPSTTPETPRGQDLLASLMSKASNTSPPVTTQEPEQQSEEAGDPIQQLLSKIPDLSFMLSNTLVLPAGTNSASSAAPSGDLDFADWASASSATSPTSSTPIAAPTPLPTSSARDSIDPPAHIKARIGWCGTMSREEVMKRMESAPIGTFLVRWSNNARSYVMSYKKGKGNVVHVAGKGYVV